MNSRFSQAKTVYGLTSNLFVDRHNDDDTIVVGGIGPNQSRWTQRLTHQAAIQLWSQLTRLLFPEKAIRVLGLAKTAPLCKPLPTVTSRFEIVQNSEQHILEILGWMGDEAWWCRIDYENARHLWTALDLLLYPAGWSGPTTLHGRLN